VQAAIGLPEEQLGPGHPEAPAQHARGVAEQRRAHDLTAAELPQGRVAELRQEHGHRAERQAEQQVERQRERVHQAERQQPTAKRRAPLQTGLLAERPPPKLPRAQPAQTAPRPGARSAE
jgi:hypothetical protein